jgi:hypothetical protein
MLEQKTYDFKGKISGSIKENPHIALLNNVEFTQQQYDNVYSSELKYNTTVAPQVKITFKVDIPVEQIQIVQFIFTAKATDRYFLARCGEDAKYQSSADYRQRILQADKVEIKNGEIFATFGSRANIDTYLYGVKLVVTYDGLIDVYSGNYFYEDSLNTQKRVDIKKETFTKIMTDLQALPLNSVDYVTFTKVPRDVITD